MRKKRNLLQIVTYILQKALFKPGMILEVYFKA